MRIRFEDCVLDLGTREVLRGERPVRLSPKAFELLQLLVEHRPNAVSKDDIHKSIWADVFVADGNLANLVSELREALGDDAHQPRIIRTVPRFGYSFPAPAEELTPAAPAPDRSGFRVVWGEKEIALAEGENLIGRDENAAVRVDHVSVSRLHARIVIDGLAAKLEDLGSKNGTHLGGRRLAEAAALRDGDAIRLGSVLLTFRRPTTGEATETASIR
jgi:DNA-binding winged helix-turn-helix (wHTH) protein